MIPRSLTHNEAVASTCTTAGNIEYWYCSTCNKYYSDANATTEITQAQTVIAASHNLTHVSAVAATCTTAGNTEYWYCEDCVECFSDADGSTEITQSDTVIEAKGHSYMNEVSVTRELCFELIDKIVIGKISQNGEPQEIWIYYKIAQKTTKKVQKTAKMA